MDYASPFDSSNSHSNYKSQYNTNDFYNLILNEVSTVLQRPLTYGEQKETISFIKNIDPNLLTPKLQKKTMSIMIKTLVNEFKSYKCEKSPDDPQQIIRQVIGRSSESDVTHSIYDNPNFNVKKINEAIDESNKIELDDEYAESDIKSDLVPSFDTDQQMRQPIQNNLLSKSSVIDILGMKTSNELVRILNPKSKERRNHMLLDSRYRNVLDQSAGKIQKFQWNYIQKSQISIDGSVNVIGNVRDIIGLRLYPFRLPYAQDSDNAYNKISLFIEELAAQSFIAHEDRKFHFMLNATIDGEFINLDADVYNGYFWFEKPITTLNTITVSFGNPLEPILFDGDRDYCGFDYFSIAPETLITTESNHNLANGDRVYFTEFKTNVLPPILSVQDSINQSIVNEINDINGHLVTVINSTQFKIAVDSSLIQSPINDLRVKVFYGSKRTFIPIEIIYIYPEINE